MNGKETDDARHKRLSEEAHAGLQELIDKSLRENMHGRIGVDLLVRNGRIVLWEDRRRRKRK